jgi:hypothetical protein
MTIGKGPRPGMKQGQPARHYPEVSPKEQRGEKSGQRSYEAIQVSLSLLIIAFPSPLSF